MLFSSPDHLCPGGVGKTSRSNYLKESYLNILSKLRQETNMSQQKIQPWRSLGLVSITVIVLGSLMAEWFLVIGAIVGTVLMGLFLLIENSQKAKN